MTDLMVEMIRTALAPETRHKPWDAPGPMAVALDPTTVQTPALELIDTRLADVAAGTIERLIINMPPQEGKLIAHDTPVPTPSGWVRHGDLRPGDEVFHPTGRRIKITATSNDADATLRVTFTDGATIVCHPRHEWTVYDRSRSQWRTVETAYLQTQRLHSGPDNACGGRYRFQLPHHDALDIDRTPLPMDAWTLGLWLGDGSTTKGCITHHVDDEHQVPYPVSSRHVHATTGVVTTYYAGMWNDLKAAGVAAGNKHIPDVYLWADEQSRWDLLCGLVDSDGYIDKSGQCFFANANQRLAAQVAQVVRSLGYRAGMQVKEPRTSSSGVIGKQQIHVVTWTPHDGRFPSRLARKAKAQGVRTRRRVAIASVTEVAAERGRCITVDSPDGLYLVGEHMTPTHNSQRTSIWFPLWLLHLNPNRRIAIVSYGHDVARRFGRRIRDTLKEHPELGLKLSQSSQRQDEFELLGYAGGLVCVGIEGSLTSRPVDVLIIDDPYKDAKQADSKAWKETVENFWREVALPRLAPGAPVVLIQTRWRQDDMAGWLAKEYAAEWTVLNIPAQADHNPAAGESDVLGREPGAYMESARRRQVHDWEKKKREVGTRSWNALYQGRPAPAEGTILKRGWWQRYDQPQWVEREDGSRVVFGFDDLLISWDMTFKKTEGTDYVAGHVWGRRGADAYLLDRINRRMDFVETLAAFRQLAARWPQATLKLVEDKANGPAVISMLGRTVPGIVPVEPDGGKEARAAAVSPLVEARNVWLPASELCPWADEVIDQCAAFPTGTHDDDVDALSQALNRLILQPLLLGHDLVTQDDVDDELADYRITPY